VAKVLLHNLTYAQIVHLIEAISKNKIQAKVLPDMKTTFSAKDVTWDTVIWGIFTTPEMQIQKTGDGVYEVTPRPASSAGP
jgi:hypothetical protein